MGATIQDGGMREKSNKPCLFFVFISLTNFSFFKKNSSIYYIEHIGRPW